jgi:hypothetical protein
VPVPLSPSARPRTERRQGTGGSELVGAEVVKVFSDKNGNEVGFCKPQQGGGVAAADMEKVPQMFCFQGNVESAGLDLVAGDKLARVKVKGGQQGKKADTLSVQSAVLYLPKRDRARFPDYLAGLRTSLRDRSRRETAVSSLCQRDACGAVWGQIEKSSSSAKGEIDVGLVEAVIGVLEGLVSLASAGGLRAAKAALSNLLASAISLPGSMLERLIASPNGGRASLCKRLVEVHGPPPALQNVGL